MALSTKTSGPLSLVSGDGISTISANVNAQVLVDAYDVTTAAKSTGGDLFFIEVQDACDSVSSFYCEPATVQSGIFTDSGPIFQQMNDNSDGTYSTSYVVKYSGLATLDVFLAHPGAFYGEYFNNAFLDGTPAKISYDTLLEFDWGSGLVTDEAADFVSIRWTGLIQAPESEQFTFVVEADDGVRLYLNDVLLIDRWDTCCYDMTASVELVQNSFYKLQLEWKEH